MKLNISQINLPSIDNPVVIEGYESAFSQHFDSQDQIDFYTVLEWLKEYPQLAKYGFWKDFGKTVFNIMVMDSSKNSINYTIDNLLKMHCLGVKDPEFNRLCDELINKNGATLIKAGNWPFLFTIKGLAAT